MNDHEALIEALDATEAYIKAERDTREPGVARKLLAERRLVNVLVRYWRSQRETLTASLSARYPLIAQLHEAGIMQSDIDALVNLLKRGDPQLLAELRRLLVDALKDGIRLFEEQVSMDFDPALTNDRAEKYATEYLTDWLDKLDRTTRNSLRTQLQAFVNTPGYTLNDVIEGLPFDRERARRVAVTEITRIYAASNQLAGELMRDEFPGVQVIKRWYTNHDDLVCDICRPLNQRVVGINDPFDVDLDISNPPAHVNCRCWTGVSTKLAGNRGRNKD